MPVRLAACDPCRSSKLACDHKTPVCTRCRDASRAEMCVYRQRPFKKRKTRQSSASPGLDHIVASVNSTPDIAGVSLETPSYPNPGYLGFSSHTTIYAHLLSDDGVAASTDLRGETATVIGTEDARTTHGVSLINQIKQALQVSACNELLNVWLSNGVDLALATSFTKHCAIATLHVFASPLERAEEVQRAARNLLESSCRPLNSYASDSLEAFRTQFCDKNTRWETLGLFFAAVTRAAADVRDFDLLYTTEQERRRFQKLAMHFSDRCLDLCMSLDCLNDLQLILQYENFIVHAFVDGDQSYGTWRKLGDVISSLFALGYHQQSETDLQTPLFLKNLRRTAFARAYSADKNMPIFLGRPPRMLRKYCRFRFPGHVAEDVYGGDIRLLRKQFEWIVDGPFDYMADTRWSGLCSILKEEVLDLRDKSSVEQIELSGVIQDFAMKQWSALPAHFRLENTLKSCDRRPIERDFMVSAKLNHLHVLFLLHLALTEHVTDPGSELIRISSRMISLVVEAVLLRDSLTNSGTGLIWRTMYYGLPAAGITCVALLNDSFVTAGGPISMGRVVQDLNVLVAEVEVGNLVRIDDPNYNLITTATKTIRTLLERLMAKGTQKSSNMSKAADVAQMTLPLPEEDWNSGALHDFCDFEMDFWLNLAEHPSLAVGEMSSQTLA